MPPILIHEDPEFFRSAITYTAATTGFQARLIEKDYFCSVVLQHLSSVNDQLVFKGGTCLAKVLVGFYRLSEDLDFVLPVETSSTRGERRRHAEPFKEAVARLPEQLPIFRLQTELLGFNNSKQYQATVEYTSLMSGQSDTIKIEIGLREPLFMEKLQVSAKTLLLNPVSGVALIESVSLFSIAELEAFAEKFRAALSRREVAIRDFYDLDHAIRKELINPHKPELIDLVRKKLSIPGNEPVDISERRVVELRRQVEAQLRPVLREDDYNQFELNRAFAIVSDMADQIAK